jgi:4-alpha-glucanotransferase
MAAERYHWFARRFTKMADYFDAYRIDHLLGFFRI